jgi:hypothetical protein
MLSGTAVGLLQGNKTRLASCAVGEALQEERALLRRS